MALIPTETVTLIQRAKTGEDDFGAPVYEETETEVTEAVVYPTSAQDVTDTLNLTGKKSVYTVCIPKGDTNTWDNTKVIIREKPYRTIGVPLVLTTTPLPWNGKIEVERYE